MLIHAVTHVSPWARSENKVPLEDSKNLGGTTEDLNTQRTLSSHTSGIVGSN